MKVLKIQCGEWKNASRDKRELSVYQEIGEDVLVMAKGDIDDHFRKDTVDGFPVVLLSTRPLGKNVPVLLNRIASVIQWSNYAKTIKPDVISGENIDGLAIGWLSNILNTNKAKLIYDAHEFEPGRNTNGRRGKIGTILVSIAEKYLIGKSAITMVVNDTIANELKRIYKLKERPFVIRNITPYWNLNKDESLSIRKKMCDALEISYDSFIMMYHGAITSQRGIEEMIYAQASIPDIYSVILGNGTDQYISSLKKKCQDLGIDDRVLFHPAVSFNELKNYIGAVDVSIMMISGKSRSYYYALPNKLFESIQATTPIIASDFPEMKKIIDEYQVGLTCSPENNEAIIKCINKLKTDSAFYETCKRNMLIAKEELCWENEKNKLKNKYETIIKGLV